MQLYILELFSRGHYPKGCKNVLGFSLIRLRSKVTEHFVNARKWLSMPDFEFSNFLTRLRWVQFFSLIWSSGHLVTPSGNCFFYIPFSRQIFTTFHVFLFFSKILLESLFHGENENLKLGAYTVTLKWICRCFRPL